MSYEIHVVRTQSWIDAQSDPISKAEISQVVANDPELTWSETDWVNESDEKGGLIRNYMVAWNGVSRFLWQNGELVCSGADQESITKLVEIAGKLNARVVGDEDEEYFQ